MGTGPERGLGQASVMWEGESRAANPGYPCFASDVAFGKCYLFPLNVVNSPEDGKDRSSSRARSGRQGPVALWHQRLCSSLLCELFCVSSPSDTAWGRVTSEGHCPRQGPCGAFSFLTRPFASSPPSSLALPLPSPPSGALSHIGLSKSHPCFPGPFTGSPWFVPTSHRVRPSHRDLL